MDDGFRKMAADKIDRFDVVNRFEMVFEGLAADGYPFFDDNLGFGLGKGITFDRIGVIGEADIIDFSQIIDQFRRQGAEAI